MIRVAMPLALLAGLVLSPDAIPTSRSAAAGDAGPVGLNHLYVYLDSLSYDALARSALLRDTIGTVREATISDTRGSWSGLYLFGRTVYLEFYRAGPSTPPPGTVALAFGVDSLGHLARVAERAVQRGLVTVPVLRERQVSGETIPWFEHRSPAEADSLRIAPVLRWWLMEYHPRYLARRPGGGPALEGRVDRAAYNQPLYATDRWLRDVTGVTIGLPATALAAAARQFEALGLERAGTGGDRFIADGVEIRLELRPSGRSGLAEIRLRVDPEAPPIERQLGSVRLNVSGGAAVMELPRQ